MFEDDTYLGLYRTAYVRFLEVVEATHRTRSIGEILTQSFVKLGLLEWLRLSKAAGIGLTFCEHLETRDPDATVTKYLEPHPSRTGPPLGSVRLDG